MHRLGVRKIFAPHPERAARNPDHPLRSRTGWFVRIDLWSFLGGFLFSSEPLPEEKRQTDQASEQGNVLNPTRHEPPPSKRSPTGQREFSLTRRAPSEQIRNQTSS